MKNNSNIDFSGMDEANEDEIMCTCPLEGTIDVISKKWSLLVINELGNKGTLRYSQISKSLKGIRPKTLTIILKELETNGIVKREAYPTVPLKVEYTLTKSGAELRGLIIPLLHWAANQSVDNFSSCPILFPKK